LELDWRLDGGGILQDRRRERIASKTDASSILGRVTISGKLGEDAKPYEERQVRHAIEEVQQ